MIVISFNSSWKFSWLGTEFFCWLNFGPGSSLGLVLSPRVLGGFDFFPIWASLSLELRSITPPAPHWALNTHTLDNFKMVRKSKRFRFLTDLVTVELKFNSGAPRAREARA